MDTTKRPREELGSILREKLDCPLCASTDGLTALMTGAGEAKTDPTLRVVAFRVRSIRLECRACKLRFSIDPENLADVLADKKQPPPSKVEADAREAAAGDPTAYIGALTEMQRLAAEFRRRNREEVLAPHRRALESAKTRKGQIRFPKR